MSLGWTFLIQALPRSRVTWRPLAEIWSSGVLVLRLCFLKFLKLLDSWGHFLSLLNFDCPVCQIGLKIIIVVFVSQSHYYDFKDVGNIGDGGDLASSSAVIQPQGSVTEGHG